MEIFTLGHSNYSVERLMDMLRHFHINCVVDIRGTPYSKYNVWFDKETIAHTLKKNGFIYIYMGEEFAAKRVRKVSYNKEGYSDFHKVVLEEEFLRGIKRLETGLEKGYKIVLLGAMQDPIRCHRSILVGRELEKHGFKVSHILDDYSIASQRDIEESILDKYFKNRNQLTIDNLLGNAKTKEDMIEEGYDLANKEIGYRIEGIDKK